MTSRRRTGAASRRGAPSSTARQAGKSKKPNRRRDAKDPAAWRLQAKRIAIVACIAVGAVGAGAGIAIGGHRLYRYVTTSPTFAIERIEVSGLARADRDEVVAVAGVKPNDNLILLDAAGVQKRVERHPWVARASVTRRFPREVSIEIEEHEPVALVALGSLYYVNAEGEVVKRRAPDEREALPVVTGISREEAERDRLAVQAKLRTAIGFLEDLRATLGKGAPEVDEVHLDPVLGLSFTLAGESTRVRIGQPPWNRQIQRISVVRDELERRGVVAREITVGGDRRPERTVARLAVRADRRLGAD